ncbi:UDP-glucose--hexose-1-phosphate uridylyltransferase [Lacticaseibacillus hulanensis]|uniref:UDP-glucose--hexose-1-phosphate uridylyltransferase n=1 Tax=Lacticaseibacillus hulanensis TaxID=2493111 RepID=UPI000FDAD3B5|nr:UDP-glucose--hexose-1-phosphate uridylyltransferase [Lacticaseibacillus hulanensis]
MDAVVSFVSHVLAVNPQYGEMDRVYLTNRVFALIGDGAVDVADGAATLDVLDALVQSATERGVITDTASAREILGAALMDLATPTPGFVNREFWDRYGESPKAATDYFYQLSRANNYIQTRAIARNDYFQVATEYGAMEITINLSKPEKDPRDIAAAAKAPQSGYPECQLCLQNEGYRGRANWPARANHRIIRMEVGGSAWGFQYSPYAYFNEHAIFLDEIHRPMHITHQTFTNLLELTTTLPHYFVGSNADLPIVGGSMLAHEHYQGGRHDFPMAKAPVERSIRLTGYPDVQAGIVKWPMSVIRLTGSDKARLADAAEVIRAAWAKYSDESVDVRAFSEDGTAHHTVTPIARRVGTDYQLDLVLRDNQTSSMYPDGIFHPHQDVQHIKKENIGLIEVMGLAILPARLQEELTQVRNYLLGQANTMAAYHKPWADNLAAKHTWTAANATELLQDEVGYVFARVLEDAGVFKHDAAGQAAFGKFCALL